MVTGLMAFGWRKDLERGYRVLREKFYIHNLLVTLMRTAPEECRELGRILAETVNSYKASGTVPSGHHNFAFLRRSALSITDTELRLIAAPATIGLSNQPKIG